MRDRASAHPVRFAHYAAGRAGWDGSGASWVMRDGVVFPCGRFFEVMFRGLWSFREIEAFSPRFMYFVCRLHRIFHRVG